MPIIFLSPSTQEYNAYVNDLGTEEEWMNHLADAMVLSLTEYFGIPFFPSSTPMPGEVRLDLGVLDVYPRPDVDATPIAQLYDGAQVTVINEYADWYLIQFGDQVGYAAAEFIAVE